jgi:hypothetical protein
MMKAHHSKFSAMRGLLVVVASCLVLAAQASGATQSELLAKIGSSGSGAGQLALINAVGTDPNDGHIFAVDNENRRIDEFTPWGDFVKAFGWNVGPGAVNEQQEVTVRATEGQFKLSFGASTTQDIEHNASAAEVEAALNSLSSISAGGGSVSVKKGASDLSSSRYVVVFDGGPLAATDVAQMTVANGTVPLSGGTSTSSATVSTRADGTGAGNTGLESCTAESGCQAGSRGDGAGQFETSRSIAIDANGDIYVREGSRVQKFDSAGRFLLMFGGEVNETTKADTCTAADLKAGDKCGPGVSGSKPGQISNGSGLATGPGNKVFVTGEESIDEFESNGGFVTSIPLSGGRIFASAVDPSSGAFYTVASEITPPVGEPKPGSVRKFSSSGAELCSFSAPALLTSGHRPLMAADFAGNVYVEALSMPKTGGVGVIEFKGDCSGTQIGRFEFAFVSPEVRALATNSAGDVLIAKSQSGFFADTDNFIELYGPPPVQYEPPPAVSPTIVAQYATSVDPEDASLQARINPHFWTDARYYLEYGTGKCSEGGCEHVQPVPPGVALTHDATNSAVTSGSVLLEGLQPSTTYHYRFVSQSGGGGPVRGVGGEVGTDGAEGTFRTTAVPGASESGCPNQAFRTGASVALPDCRAYEMVSPVDKSNADIRDLVNPSGFPTRLRQSAPDGEAFAYSAYRAFGSAPAGVQSAQYLAKRSVSGWVSDGIGSPHNGDPILATVAATETEFKAFSTDLCSAWVINAYAKPLLAAGALEAFPNLYRRDNCSGSFEALTTTALSGERPKAFSTFELAELQGFSANGAKSIFRLPLEMGSEPNVVYGTFEASGGEMKPVCVLPDGTPVTSGCSAGTAGGAFFFNRGSSVSHAISADGSRIYWSAGNERPGRVYLRLDGATTVPVSETQTKLPAQFLGASADGSQALFMPIEGPKADGLYLYSLANEASTRIAGETIGLVGASEDLSYVYYASKEAIGGANAEGEAPVNGKPNLYLYHEGTSTFVAPLSKIDVERSGVENAGDVLSDVAPQGVLHVARATPDGSHLIFISTEPLTGYDNTDAKSGEADLEVFQYSADDATLNCVSCSPGGARPVGRGVGGTVGGQVTPAAAMIPGGETQLYSPRAQSEDGGQVFFTSYGPLVSRDTNGVADVYEWERPGAGSCLDSSTAFSAANGGCVYLISNGTSPADSALVDISADGRDVFFTTNASLLPQDPGLVDIYDARAGGGFPAPPVKAAVCEGEACQGPLAPPNDPTPASSSFQGAGNVKEPAAKKKTKKHKKAHKKKRKHAHKRSAKGRTNNR